MEIFLMTIYDSFNIYDEYMNVSTNDSNLRILSPAKHHFTNSLLIENNFYRTFANQLVRNVLFSK